MNTGSPHWHPAIQCIRYSQKRRRIVAQVRRKTPKYLDFCASQKFFHIVRQFVDEER